MAIQELNGDQTRETVNSFQRFGAYRHALEREEGYRGSMSFADRGGVEYLLRDYYDPKSGVRRQKSLGRRDAQTEATYVAFTEGKALAAQRRRETTESLDRQAAVNRALRLGRIPEIGARIIRTLDEAGILGNGLKIVGTNAIFAYEAVAGVHLSSDITATEDIDLLFDARASIRLALDEGVEDRSLLGVLRQADKSFQRSRSSFHAVNNDGYYVDLIKPEPRPPWRNEAESISADGGDLQASPIRSLAWHQGAPTFEAVAIDARGYPLRIVSPDPRAFAVHKLWLSTQPERDPVKRRRDLEQARTVAEMVRRYFQHLPFGFEALRSFPKDMVADAAPLFEPPARTE